MYTFKCDYDSTPVGFLDLIRQADPSVGKGNLKKIDEQEGRKDL